MCALLFQETSKLCHAPIGFQIILKLPRMTLPVHKCSGIPERAVEFHYKPKAACEG
jgi:hypothetical protein